MSFRSVDLFNLVKDFGETVTLHKVTDGGSYNPRTGGLDNKETTDYNAITYFYNYDEGIIFNVDQVRRGNRKCVISALGLAVEPEEGDEISGNGDKVVVVNVRSIFSNGAKLCYICDVRE